MNDTGIYKELYHYDDKHSLVMNEITHDVCFMKTLVHYDISVYQYIKDNPNKFIPRIYDFIERDNVLCVVEEFIQGSSFDSVIYSGKLSDEVKLNYFVQLCYGIKYLHDAPHQIIHRDIKLSNIIIAEDGDLKIIDYDAAKVYKPGAKRDTVLIGTEGMAAPEQYGFRQSDERTDIYAIGLLIREAFPNDQRLLKIADKASAFNPDERYKNIGELITALKGGSIPQKKKSRLFPIPGFRTGNPYKMAVSASYWALIFVFAFIINPYRTSSLYSYIVFALYEVISAFFAVDIVCDWTGLFRKAPGAGLSGPLRYTVRILYAAAFVAILFIAMAIAIAFPKYFMDTAGL